MTRMLREITKTWNPIVGCLHNCKYCWAKNYSKRLQGFEIEPYKTYGFLPAFAEWKLKDKFPRNSHIFVSDMGDMWGEWVPKEWIIKVLDFIRNNSQYSFFFLTKNPIRYSKFLDSFSDNITLGATIEGNRSYGISNAPIPEKRYLAMKDLKWEHKVIVIEPILDFDLEIFVNWIKEIDPEGVYVGYDNYHNNLAEPIMSRTQELLDELNKFTIARCKTLRRAWYE